MMALKFGRCRRLSRQSGIELCKEIQKLPDIVQRTLEVNDEVAALAPKYSKVDNAFFIGRGYLYPVALEGALNWSS